MNLTNRLRLPKAIVDAVANDPYDKGDCDFSCTELLKPPKMCALERLHQDEITEDVSDRLWSLYGQVAHTILERANRVDLCEERYFAKFGSHTVSAQIDTMCIESGMLTDYKFTSAYKFKNKTPSEEWAQQMNIQLEILRKNNINPTALQIVGLLRDWSKTNALRDENYPQTPIKEVFIPIWARVDTQRFIKQRINEHLRARGRPQETVCSQNERWATDDKWAVMIRGRKRAYKLCDNAEYATILKAKLIYDKKKAYVEIRKGESKRCQAYCSAAPFCDQWKEISEKLETQEAQNDGDK